MNVSRLPQPPPTAQPLPPGSPRPSHLQNLLGSRLRSPQASPLPSPLANHLVNQVAFQAVSHPPSPRDCPVVNQVASQVVPPHLCPRLQQLCHLHNPPANQHHSLLAIQAECPLGSRRLCPRVHPVQHPRHRHPLPSPPVPPACHLRNRAGCPVKCPHQAHLQCQQPCQRVSRLRCHQVVQRVSRQVSPRLLHLGFPVQFQRLLQLGDRQVCLLESPLIFLAAFPPEHQLQGQLPHQHLFPQQHRNNLPVNRLLFRLLLRRMCPQ
jgi:hypothetical protein